MARSTIRYWGAPGEVVDRFAGLWTLERRIAGHAAMRGTARFAPLPGGGIEYREEGELRLATGEQLDATRSYRFRALSNGFAVFFAEAPPRLFHEISLVLRSDGSLAGEARHLCAPDLYLSEYRFAPDGQFSVRHAVRGPRKDYMISTRYRRVTDEGFVGEAP
ncbi:MAG TPA: DUF6314 family protein [Stellaceae bacterium]|nr:DUF6314 family protein [Stellaceae bacterium]